MNPTWYWLHCFSVSGCCCCMYIQKRYHISRLSMSVMCHISTWKYLARQANYLGVSFTWSMLGGFGLSWDYSRPEISMNEQKISGFGRLHWLLFLWVNLLHQLGHNPEAYPGFPWDINQGRKGLLLTSVLQIVLMFWDHVFSHSLVLKFYYY